MPHAAVVKVGLYRPSVPFSGCRSRHHKDLSVAVNAITFTKRNGIAMIKQITKFT
jgi:hypothetical protein